MKLKRKDVIDLLIAKLTEIKVVNGYSCDIGQSVSYAEGIVEEPLNDCIAVIDGREVFGSVTRSLKTVQRTLEVNINACFVGDTPAMRANVAVEDIIEFLNKHPSLDQSFLRVELVAMQVYTDELERIAELVTEIKITY